MNQPTDFILKATLIHLDPELGPTFEYLVIPSAQSRRGSATGRSEQALAAENARLLEKLRQLEQKDD